jgi:glutathione S-transferase
MYRVYWAAGTGSFIPIALLTKVEAPWEGVRLDTEAGQHRAPDYLAINPMGQIPALVLPGGTVLTETAAMILHFADAFPEAQLAPPGGTSARATFDRWLIFLSSVVYEADLRAYYPERYTADEAGVEGVRHAARERLEQAATILREHALRPGPFVLGHRFTAVDLYAAMLVSWMPEGPGRTALAPLVQAVEADPLYAPIWRRVLKGEEEAAGT